MKSAIFSKILKAYGDYDWNCKMLSSSLNFYLGFERILLFFTHNRWTLFLFFHKDYLHQIQAFFVLKTNKYLRRESVGVQLELVVCYVKPFQLIYLELIMQTPIHNLRTYVVFLKFLHSKIILSCLIIILNTKSLELHHIIPYVNICIFRMGLLEQFLQTQNRPSSILLHP